MKTNWLMTIRDKLTEGLTWKKIFFIIIGAGICTFGIHNIHQRTGITEGGVIGMMLLVERWLGISPSAITSVLDISCYLLAFKYLGGQFIKISMISTFSVSLFYKFWELFPPMLPDLSEYPLAAAIGGGLFVGIGVGIIVRQGGSSGGDDALALTISRVTHWRLSRSYLFTDLVVDHGDHFFFPHRSGTEFRKGQGIRNIQDPDPGRVNGSLSVKIACLFHENSHNSSWRKRRLCIRF